jgi:uncharacterized protein YlxW (UPF0749 family)
MAVTTVGTAVGESSGTEPLRQSRSWVWQVTALSLVLGALLGLALRSQWQIRQLQLPGNRFSTLAAAYGDLKRGNEELQSEVRKLREQITTLETQISKGTSETEAINSQLQQSKLLAGLTPVRGPGLIITLHDTRRRLSPEDADQGIVHDQDINAILSELKAAGAEALAIAGADRESEPQRVTALTTARCAGPGMKVNDTVLGAPYRIFAIGNPVELESQLKIPNGVIDNAGLEYLGMIRIEHAKEITIPGYAGSLRFQHAQKVD